MPVDFDLPAAALFFLSGLVCGSFGNVLILRLPAGKPITGRSQCPKCRKRLSAWELIPVLSYALLGGRCRHCRKPISAQYPLVESASAGLFLLAFALHGATIIGVLLALALWLLLLIAVIDGRTQGIPDALSLPFILLTAAYAFTAGIITLAAPLSLLVFFGVQWLFSRGAWVGSGDILLGIGIGFLLGDLPRTLLCLGLAYVIGALYASILLLLRKATRKTHVPFGPFLAAATLLTMLLGNQMLGVLVY